MNVVVGRGALALYIMLYKIFQGKCISYIACAIKINF